MAAADRHPLRLVLVEDSDGYAAAVERLLAAEPDAPTVVRLGLDDALRYLARAKADCVLLDPELQGAEALERILAVAPAMPLVVLTADAGEDHVVRLIGAGAQDHVVKGTETGPTLLRAVRRAIERRRTGDRQEVERLVREAVDDVGRAPEQRHTRERRRRDAFVGTLGVLLCVVLQGQTTVTGLSALLVLPVGWLAARVSLTAGLAAGAIAVVSSALRPVLAGDGFELLSGIGVRSIVFAAAALVAWQATRRLSTSNELLHGILSGTSDALTVKDLAGRYLLVNDAAAALIGRSRDAILGRTDAELVPADLATQRRVRDEAVLATGHPQRYWRTAIFGEVERTHSVVKLPYRDGDGRLRGVVTVARDETAMRRLEEETARFFDLAPDMLCTVGPDGRLERINDAWTGVLGWTSDDLRSRPLVDFIHPEDRALAGHEMALLLAGLIEGCTNRVATKAGGWRNIEWSARVIAEEGRAYAVARDVTERDAMARALAESEARYRTLVHHLPGSSVLTFNHELLFTFAAGNALSAFGVDEDIRGRSLAEVWPDTAARIVPHLRAALAGEVQSFEYEAADGTAHWVHMAPLRDADEHVVGGMVLAQDISDRRAVEREVTQAEGRFRSAFDQAPIGMALIALDGRYLQVNEAMCAITGYPSERMLQMTVNTITHPDDADECQGGRSALIEGRVDGHRIEKRYVHADGHTVWVDVHGTLIRDADGRPSHVLGQIQDVTERRRFERRLQHLADHDPLTGLLNRRRFEAELDRHVSAVRRYGAEGAVLVLDLDDFKLVNDSLGHSAGDELIVGVAAILRAQLRDSDVIARLGGDELAVLMPRGGAEDAEIVADKLVRAIREEATVVGGARPLRVTTSIGIAAFEDESTTGEEILINADLAMYEAKDAGRNGYAVHSPDGDARPQVQERVQWLERIRDAVASDLLVLHAQPILDLRSGAVTQYELLVRLRDAAGGLISPAAFLPLAERYDLVQSIDRWVAKRALELVAAHARHGLRLTVNLSGRTLSDEGLLEDLQSELARTGADPGSVTFEVTETAAVSNIHRAREFAERLRAIGCRFALDDFGAGFGSFYYLKHLPFDYLKIDGEFVANCLSNRTDQLVIRAVVDIAQGLGKETVAEFASDPELVQFLATQGVDYAQGFEIGRPVALEEMLAGLGAAAVPGI
jgi:diguanylate cyclase (GGDEF)-like protein/PAS domain S-box-containing protein